MKRLRLRWLSGLCAAGLPLLGQGCASLSPATAPAAVLARAAPPDGDQLPSAAPSADDQGSAAEAPDRAPAPPASPAPAPAPPAAGPCPPPKPVPISLDTVFRLAQEQNAKVGIARERVNEAFAEQDVAAKKWLPDVYLGTSYYRHEGAIQNEDGTVTHSSFGSLFGGLELDARLDVREIAYTRVNAERQTWQRRGDLSKLTSQTLLEAASTYLDLLAAYQSIAIIRSTDDEMQKLFQKAKGLLTASPGTRVDVPRIQAEMAYREQQVIKFKAQAQAAKAKLAYLLGLGPDCDLLPVDNRLAALNLVNASVPDCELVAQALTSGPGIREMEGLLNLIQESIAKAQGPGKYLPVVGVRMAEGLFGGGPGASSDWDNRWDLALQVRWNLTELATVSERRRVAQARLNQLHLNYQDLRGRLTADVREAREIILSGPAQFSQAESDISYSKETVGWSFKRFEAYAGTEGRVTASETLAAIGRQARAQLNYLSILRDYDKAQVELLILLGQVTAPPDPHCGK